MVSAPLGASIRRELKVLTVVMWLLIQLSQRLRFDKLPTRTGSGHRQG
jgi:hypothetical protein